MSRVSRRWTSTSIGSGSARSASHSEPVFELKLHRPPRRANGGAGTCPGTRLPGGHLRAVQQPPDLFVRQTLNDVQIEDHAFLRREPQQQPPATAPPACHLCGDPNQAPLLGNPIPARRDGQVIDRLPRMRLGCSNRESGPPRSARTRASWMSHRILMGRSDDRRKRSQLRIQFGDQLRAAVVNSGCDPVRLTVRSLSQPL